MKKGTKIPYITKYLGDKRMKIKINGIYKHYKGDYYIVEDIATNSETLEKYVIYRALYDDNKLWIRSLTSFTEEINKNNQKYRFELASIASKRDH